MQKINLQYNKGSITNVIVTIVVIIFLVFLFINSKPLEDKLAASGGKEKIDKGFIYYKKNFLDVFFDNMEKAWSGGGTILEKLGESLQLK